MIDPTVIHIVGNRPQFVKLAVLYHAIAKESSLRQMIIHTGQHASAAMSGIFFNALSIPPADVQLNIQESTTDAFIGAAAVELTTFLLKRPAEDMVIVYGDTNSTLAGALSARRSGKKLIHFESGVRTENKSMPEEINRIITDRLADIQYCCTELNVETLQKEGFGSAIPSEVVLTGDLMLDAFLQIEEQQSSQFANRQYIACTIHRAANITDKQALAQIVAGLNRIHQEMEVIIPLHPHTAARLSAYSIQLDVTVLDPLPYGEMKNFISGAQYVITDSGGASREAFFAKKKSLIIMESPFWPEILKAGAALNCTADATEIVSKFSMLSNLAPVFDQKIFGDGTAAIKIARHLNSLAF